MPEAVCELLKEKKTSKGKQRTLMLPFCITRQKIYPVVR